MNKDVSSKQNSQLKLRGPLTPIPLLLFTGAYSACIMEREMDGCTCVWDEYRDVMPREAFPASSVHLLHKF